MVRDYVVSLEKRNARRQREIAQLHTDKVELNGRIKALEEQLNLKKVDIRYHFPADWRPGARKIVQRRREDRRHAGDSDTDRINQRLHEIATEVRAGNVYSDFQRQVIYPLLTSEQ